MLSSNIPPWKLFRWFRKLQLWATGDWQLHHDSKSAHASYLILFRVFWQNIKSHRWLTTTLQPRFVALPLLTFPKTKVIFEREEISDHQWDSGKYKGQMMVIPTKDFAVFWTVEEMLGEVCEAPRCLLWSGVRYHFPIFFGDIVSSLFLVSCIFFNKWLYFS